MKEKEKDSKTQNKRERKRPSISREKGSWAYKNLHATFREKSTGIVKKAGTGTSRKGQGGGGISITKTIFLN